jgi:hypothetical protein
MIDINKLNNNDIGKWVLYDNGFKKERGKIKSWNDTVIFVVYHCDNQWHNFKDYTGAGTFPEELNFIEEV